MAMTTITNQSYDGSSIKVLKGLSAVRLRPGMYVGDSGKKGLHHLVWEIVDNAVDEAMAGHCDHIAIEIAEDGETIFVEDNGRGIPVDMHPTEKRPTLEVVLSTLHAGGKFGGSGYSASGGLHGVGASCVTALCEHMTATVRRDKAIHAIEFSRGSVFKEMYKIGPMKRGQRDGTRIEWKADIEIFKAGVELDEKILINRLREVAYLNRNILVTFNNKKTGTSHEFKYAGGIADYVSYLTTDKESQLPSEPIYIDGKSQDGTIGVQVALAYTKDEDETVLTFCNNIHTVDGGTHLSGFRSALTRVVNQFYKSVGGKKDKDDNLSGNDVREGLTAIVSVLVPQPELVGQTKAKLGTVEAEGITSQVVYEQLTVFFEKNSPIIKQIIERAKLSQRARLAARKSADLIKRKNVFGGGGMPGKLYDCQSKDKKNSELYIVEGDSAAGSAKGGRDAKTQAIMPIRGKMINAEKHSFAALLKNTEVVDLIKAIGTGVKDDFDIEKLRYDKIIIMADADDDGSHIATLLMTFFYRFMKPMVTGGHLYIAMPPLYAVKKGSKITYCWNDQDKDDALAKNGGKVTRFKGLGEMDEEQLGETTMEVGNRRLIRLEVNDIAEAEKVISVLMGSNVTARKARLKENINK